MSCTVSRNSSEEDWEVYSSFGSPQRTPSPVDKERDLTPLAKIQYDLLQEKEKSQELTEKPRVRQILFSNTILILASEGFEDLAMQTLKDAENKGVWDDFKAERAKFYKQLVEKILEKGVHQNAIDLYSHALENLVWEGFPSQKEAASNALNQAGFKV